ncbi:hypothetical protein DF182_28640 [Chitinophaga flava]|uniref:Uncharacterized protein n=1 Tax=Chitinophaga flava TaxID=2259036 RepID=A0A365XWQ6_9BACT|nr:hypothetical protein DF182_28640 [Chitinophaga flava]
MGIAAGVISAVLSLIYAAVYQTALGADFSAVVPVAAVASANIAAGVLMMLAYWLWERWCQGKAVPVFNVILIFVSLLSSAIPLAVSLPLNIPAPELFPGMVVPMHLFPVLVWLGLQPLLSDKNRTSGGR